MCFLSKTLHSPHWESKSRVILRHSFLAESEEVSGLLCVSGRSIQNYVYTFDPWVLRWRGEK